MSGASPADRQRNHRFLGRIGVGGTQRRRLRRAAAGLGRRLAVPDDSSSSAEFSGRLGREHTRRIGVTVSSGEDSVHDRAAVILTPDQPVRVSFPPRWRSWLSSGRRRGGRSGGCTLVPLWFEFGVRPHPPLSMCRAFLEQSQIFTGIYWQRYGWVGPGSGYTP